VQQNENERKRITHEQITVITESALPQRGELSRAEDRVDFLQNNCQAMIKTSDNEIGSAQGVVDSLRQQLADAEQIFLRLKVH
jgi:hypothetical protein